VPYAKVEVYLRTETGLEKVGEGTAVYTDRATPLPYELHELSGIRAGIYCNGVLVGTLYGVFTDTVAAGTGGTAEKVITFKVIIQ
jgi:hypothetical protein